MKTFLVLFKKERHRSLNWLRDNTASKLFVIFGFLAVILAIVFAEYKIGSIYLNFASEYPPFGPAMALYSLKVAVFFLFIFAIISSTSISISTLYQNSSLSHLFTLPLKPNSIFISKIIPGWLTSSIVLMLIFPLFIIYNRYIFKSPNFIFITVIGLLILSFVSQALGTIFATGMAYFLGKITRRKQFIIFLSLLVGLFVLIKLLFPSNLFKLYDAENFGTFQSQLNSFPLMGKILPTNWLIDGLSGQVDTVSTISTLIALFCLFFIVKTIGSKYYLVAWRRAQNQSYLAGVNAIKGYSNSHFPKIMQSKSILLPLIVNDIISIIRSNVELNYSVFLGSLLAILIFSIRNLVILKDTTPGLLMAIYLIAYVSLVLIYLISAIRLIFPLIAKEKFTSWFSFSLPLPRKKYLIEKILVSIILGLPNIIVSIIVVSGLRLASEKSVVLVALMFFTVLLINILQCLFGAINPNFKEAANSDAISTSSMGIFSLLLSLLIIIVTTIQLNNYFHGNISSLGLAMRWIFTAIVVLFPTFLIAIRSTRKYSL